MKVPVVQRALLRRLAGAALMIDVGGGCTREGAANDTLPAPPVSPSPPQWFREVTSEVGLDFVYDTGAKGDLHLAEIMGAGAALFDYDNDGDLDIYLVNGNHELPKMTRAVHPRNRLFRQEPGGRFVDVTDSCGLGDGGYGMGVAVGDIDNDGDLDVYITNFGPDRLCRNMGDGVFEDITVSSGVRVDGWSCSATFLDYDLDGFLDLYVTQYLEFNPLKVCTDGAGRRDYCGPTALPPVHDVLLHGNGDGTFRDVSEQAGMDSVAAAGLGVIAEDFNEDGYPDIYVANDAYANQLWINQRDGTFHDAAFVTGTAYNWNGAPEAGMGVVAADFDNDADFDLFLTHLGNETNTLYRNLGPGAGFEDVSGGSGLGLSSSVYTGFGTAAFDAELDGDLDVVVVNGRVVRGERRSDASVPSPWNWYAEPNLFYMNRGHGRFELIPQETAAFCDRVEITRGLAIGDIDADGDLDVLINNIQGPARLYRNEAPRRGHWLRIRALDPQLRRDAIGAVVSVYAGDRRFVRTITSGFGYLSASDPTAHFGLGETNRVDRIEVRWPGRGREVFTVGAVDQTVVLKRGTGRSLVGADAP